LQQSQRITLRGLHGRFASTATLLQSRAGNKAGIESLPCTVYGKARHATTAGAGR